MREFDPMISIVVPTYNRGHLIAETLKSLQHQEYDQYEIIVVDDGSTDNTKEIVEQIADHKTRYISKANGERAAARNFGARAAKGKYINFFDSDDLALPNHLKEAANLIQKHKNPEWFHLGFAWATPELQVFKKINHFRGSTLNSYMPNGNQLSCNGVFVRRDIVLSHSFNEDRTLSASEDYELWLRLSARYPLYYSNEITSWIIDHDARSVRKINGEKLINRLHLLIQYAKSDEQVMSQFGKDFVKIEADSYSYIALHLADWPKYKYQSIKYLLRSFIVHPYIIKSKRFYAVLKNILLKWQKF